MPLFAGANWEPELPIVFGDARGDSGTRPPEDATGSGAGAPTRPTRFRLRYSRIHAARRDGSR